MALSSAQTIGDGQTKVFTFSFVGAGKGYLRESDVQVFIDGSRTVGYTFPTENSIELPVAPAAGAEVLIRRVMPVSEAYATFSRGSDFSSKSVNNSFLQQLYLAHEVIDGYVSGNIFADLNMNGHTISGLADGVNPQDAVTKSQLDVMDANLVSLEQTANSHVVAANLSADSAHSSYLSSVDSQNKAAGYASDALVYAGRASASATLAKTHSDTAAHSATAASASESNALAHLTATQQSEKRAEELVHVAATPLASVQWFVEDPHNPPTRVGMVRPEGQELQRDHYKPLWDKVNADNAAVTDAEWLAGQDAAYSSGNGTSTFRLPNLKGYYVVTPDTAGTNDPSGATRKHGEAIANLAQGPAGKSVWMQPYIVYGGLDPTESGLHYRGTWDATANVVYGDPLNSTIVKGQAPHVEAGMTSERVAYFVIKGGTSDVMDDSLVETPWVAGDQLFWVGSAPTPTWMHSGLSSVDSVNGLTGDVQITPDNLGVLPLTGGTVSGDLTVGGTATMSYITIGGLATGDSAYIYGTSAGDESRLVFVVQDGHGGGYDFHLTRDNVTVLTAMSLDWHTGDVDKAHLVLEGHMDAHKVEAHNLNVKSDSGGWVSVGHANGSEYMGMRYQPAANGNAEKYSFSFFDGLHAHDLIIFDKGTKTATIIEPFSAPEFIEAGAKLEDKYVKKTDHRNIHVLTSDPTNTLGEDGDIAFVVEP